MKTYVLSAFIICVFLLLVRDGVTGRVSTTNLRGFQPYWTFGHTRARNFPPENGGPVSHGHPLATAVFRIDHDQGVFATFANPITTCAGIGKSKLLTLPPDRAGE